MKARRKTIINVVVAFVEEADKHRRSSPLLSHHALLPLLLLPSLSLSRLLHRTLHLHRLQAERIIIITIIIITIVVLQMVPSRHRMQLPLAPPSLPLPPPHRLLLLPLLQRLNLHSLVITKRGILKSAFLNNGALRRMITRSK